MLERLFFLSLKIALLDWIFS